MSENEQGLPRLSIEDWQVENIRLTIFPSAQPDEQTWWADIVGRPSDNIFLQQRPRIRREEGIFEKGRLVLATSADRIDWLFVINLGGQQDEKGIFTIGNFPECLERFTIIMEKWFNLGTCPPTKRLAFGAVLLYPVESQQKGQQQISAFLPGLKLDLDDSSDFIYQINRPKESKIGIPEFKINRLSVWSVTNLVVAEGKISISPPSARQFPVTECPVCRLVLDINTMHDFKGEISQEQIPMLFTELVTLGKEIAERGDIR